MPLSVCDVCTGCAGKSTIAQQLASRINIPNVMQTDVIYEVRHDSTADNHSFACRACI
jgi:2-phosphoglycerate kinase